MGREIDFTNPNEYKAFLSMQNSEEFQKLYRFYQNKTMMDILGVARQENPHSSFIAWLLNDKESHELGTYAMERFLETICFAYKKYGIQYLTEEVNLSYKNEFEEKTGKVRLFTNQELENIKRKLLFFECKGTKDKSNLISNIMYQNYGIMGLRIERERKIAGTRARRADIWIELELMLTNADTKKLLILIENKVHSSENENQTLAYMQAIMGDAGQNYDFDYFIPIFLYPATKEDIIDAVDINTKSFPCINRLFLLLNYQYLMDGVLYPCRTHAENNVAVTKLDDYMACLSQSIFGQGDEGTKERSSIMAISPREKELASQLWDKYKEVLLDIGLNLDKKDLKYIYDNRFFYQTILRPICDDLGDDISDDESDLAEALSAQVDDEKAYYLRTSDDVVLKFASGAGAGKNISAFAYVIMYQFWKMVDQNKDITIPIVKECLSKRVKNKWLAGFLVTEEEEKALYDEWAKLSKQGSCVCEQYRVRASLNDDDTLNGCPLDDGASNPLGKKLFKPGDETRRFYTDSDCPIYKINNGTLRSEYYGMTNNSSSTVGTRGQNCSCYYDFLHCFCVKDIEKEHSGVEIFSMEPDNMKKNDCNRVFPKIPVGNGKFVYMSRYWFRDDIKQMVQALDELLINDKLENYWSCKSPDGVSKLLISSSEIDLSQAIKAAK